MRRLLWRDGILLAESAALLLLVRLAMLFCPFATVLDIVNRATAAPLAIWRRGPRTIERVRWAVVTASRCFPGTRHCLTQALVAKTLLGIQNPTVGVRIGVAKDDAGRLIAHAWLEADGIPIFGMTGSELNRYTRLPSLDRV